MLKSYIQIALRNLRRQTGYSLINISGLALGLASALVIALFIRSELSFDDYHRDADRLYRVYNEYEREGVVEGWARVPGPFAAFLERTYPQVEETARLLPLESVLVDGNNRQFYEHGMILADASVLDVLNLPLKYGPVQSALDRPNTVLLTEDVAAKYFGKTDPIGKTLRVNRTTDLTVTGILRNIPNNTHLRFDFLVSMGSVDALLQKGYLDNEFNTVALTYVKLRPFVDSKTAGTLLADASALYFNHGAPMGTFHLQPIRHIHLHSELGGEYAPNGHIETVYVLGFIAFLVLLVACINYANLSVALYNRRTREIGLRKILGAGLRHMAALTLMESFLIVLLAAILALIGLQLSDSLITSYLGYPLALYASLGSLLGGLTIIIIVTTLVASTYPVWYLIRLQSLSLLEKGPAQANRRHLTHALVLVQFVVFVVLLVLTITVHRQTDFLQRTDLGFSREALLVIPLQDETVRGKTSLIKQELLAQPAVLRASASSDLPGRMKWITSIDYEGKPEGEPSTMTFLNVDSTFIETFGIEVINGNQAPGQAGTGSHSYLLNETAVRKLNWADPIGKRFTSLNDGDGQVVGVMRDFHFKPLHESIEPLFLSITDGPFEYLTLRLDTKDLAGTMRSVERHWKKIVPDAPFEYFFYDSFYDNLYRSEVQFGKATRLFTLLTVLIACFGLFGHASFSVTQRTKEIGIRKVLGASVAEIVVLFTREYILWVAVAFVVAVPIAYMAVDRWLQDFAYRVHINVGIFLLAGVVALCLALLAVSAQVIRAALSDPVEALRYE